MMIPLVDLKAQYNSIKDEIDEAIHRVLKSGEFILGKEVEKLEEEIAEYLGARYAIGVASGTDALYLSLLAYGISFGDEVITTPFTFIATSEVISLLGARPVFVDISPKTYNIDPSKIKECINSRTKAIIPVHLYGQPAELDSIIELAKENNLKVIEDAAQSIGAEYKGKKVGHIGDVGCFSFFPSKNLGCFGDGGMVVTDSEEVARKIRMLRTHGSSEKYVHLMIGKNSRLDAIQAAILRVKLKYLQSWTDARRKNAALYNELLKDVVEIPYEMNDCKHVYNQYTIRVDNRERIRSFLKKKGVSTAVHYPIPLHLQKAFSHLGYEKGSFKESEKASREVLSLPNYPELSESDIQRIAMLIKEVV
ncbi:MAG: DegT/DnrJ/EryC1/StrS family aminotransferase [bacterium]|nr:DegT/DnrJ/EryC1/StrS family aminotransferase [bacterium]